MSRQVTVHLHVISLDQPDSECVLSRAILSDQERRRADRFARAHSSRRWTAARAGLKSILAAYSGVPAAEIVIREGGVGKPRLDDSLASSPIRFNLSHSDSLAVAAVCTSGPVGVDIERVRDIRDWESVAGRFFSPWENAQVEAAEESIRQRLFFHCWTRKEAVIKATGEGFSAKLDSFDVSIAPNQSAAVVADRSADGRYSGWQLRHFDIRDHFVGAIAARGPQQIDFACHGFWQSRPG